MSKTPPFPWQERQSGARNARTVLPKLISDYFGRGRELLAKDPSRAEMHAFRLATKRIRYSLDLFRPCYGPALVTRMASLRHLQQLLGEINDTAVTERLLREALPGKTAQRVRIEKFLRRRAMTKSQEFRQYWTGTFDAPGQEQSWTVYLSRHAKDATDSVVRVK